jgi:all-trans-8'-apo-beta-carotenal 15,15'-oxygenase
LTRFILDPDTGKVERTVLTANPGELPTIHPQRTGKTYKFVWSLSKPVDAPYNLLDAIQKTNVETGAYILQDYHPWFPGEPVFIPAPDAKTEDEGWVVFLMFDPKAQETWLFINDGKSLQEITRAKLPHNIPLGFHGKFVEEVFLS